MLSGVQLLFCAREPAAEYSAADFVLLAGFFLSKLTSAVTPFTITRRRARNDSVIERVRRTRF